MASKRNIGIIGANSEASEVFAALLRFDQTPKPDWKGLAVLGSDTTDWGEYDVEDSPPPYDATKRKKLFGD